MGEIKNTNGKDYFDDPIIDDIKKRIIEDIDFFSYETPHSVQDHIASQYSQKESAKPENKPSSECMDPETK